MRSASLEEHLSDQSTAYRIIQMSKRRNPSVAVNQHRLCTTPESSVAHQMNLVSWSKLGLIRPISDPVLAAFALITDKLRSRWIRSRLSRRHRLLLSLTHHSGRASPKWHSRPILLNSKLCVSCLYCLHNPDKFYANKLIYILNF